MSSHAPGFGLAHAFRADATGTEPGRHTVFTARDAGQAHELVKQHYCEHKLHPASAAPLAARMDAAVVGGVQVSRLQYGGAVSIEPAQHKDFWLISTTLCGSGDISVGNNRFNVRAGDTTLHAPDRDSRMRFDAADSQLNVLVNKARIERFFLHWCGAAAPANLYFEPRLESTHPDAAEYHCLLAMLVARATVASPTDDLLLQEWNERLEEMLYAFLLLRCQHSGRRVMQGEKDNSLPLHVRRAEAFIRANLAEPLTLATIATAAGVSVRSLTAGFQTHRGTTVMKLLRLLRLERAHSELGAARSLDRRPGVALIASRWGYQHMSQFAADYKRCFGVSPSATLNGRATTPT